MPGDACQHILIVHEALPQPDRNGCDVRLMQVVDELLAQGHRLTYVSRRGGDWERYARPLEQLGIGVCSGDVERFRRFGLDAVPPWTLEAVLKNGRPDLAILFLWFWNPISIPEDYLDDIRRLSPRTRVAVLSDDQHGLRERRLTEVSGRRLDLERAHDVKQRELEVYRQADMVLAISEADRQGMLATAPDLEIEILPMMAAGAPAGPEFAPRADILFLGSFENPANLEGLNWLLREIWPRLAASLPEIELHLAGHHLPQGRLGERIVSLGYVEDRDAAFAAHRVFVSPVRHCTGVQTKILPPLASGLPVVTTPAAAEGLNLKHGSDVLVASTAEEFAEQIKRLYTDEHLWQRLSQGGAEVVNGQASRERLAAQIRRLTERIRALEPKAYDPRHLWSLLRIEKEFPEILTGPSPERLTARLRAHCQLAELLLAEGETTVALEQLRHVFSYLRGEPVPALFTLFTRVLLDLDRCYRNLGTSELPVDFVREARVRLPSAADAPPSSTGPEGAADSRSHYPPSHSSKRRGIRGKRPRPDFSVIIPTYNRCAVLTTCLAALEAQSLAKDRFEVIVIDDGSSDGTEHLCRGLRMPFPLVYLRQTNAGAGAARQRGTEAARGEYLLLFNDDTLATPGLLAEHLAVQRQHSQEKCAVGGHFRYPAEARKRALSSYFATRPFLFPQTTMAAGFYTDPKYFTSCNLSIRREAVLQAGSFDPQFRVAEDTELGVRLAQQGYRILFHPAALAWHDHLNNNCAELIKRAHAYAAADLLLYRKHPALLGSGTGLFGRLDAEWAARTRDSLAQLRQQVADWTQALARFDKLDFAPLFSLRRGPVTEAELVLQAFDQIVPQIQWFYRFERLLELREEAVGLQPSAVNPRQSAIGPQPSAVSG